MFRVLKINISSFGKRSLVADYNKTSKKIKEIEEELSKAEQKLLTIMSNPDGSYSKIFSNKILEQDANILENIIKKLNNELLELYRIKIGLEKQIFGK